MKNSDRVLNGFINKGVRDGRTAAQLAINERYVLFMQSLLDGDETGGDVSPAPIFDAFPSLNDYDVPNDLLFDVLNWAIGEVVNGGFIPDTGETQSSDGV